MANSTIKKFLDAGAQFTEMSKKQAESLVKTLIKSGEMQRKDADRVIQKLFARGKETTDKISALVQHEVAQQVSAFSERFDEMEDRVEALAKSLRGNASKVAATPAPAPAEKVPAKKVPAKKAAAAKVPAKKAPAKKAPAKAVGASGVRKVATSRKG